MDKQYFVYLLTNHNNTVLYTGVTNNLIKRIYQHKNKLVEGFTKRYNIDKLVYFEVISDINEAIRREKAIKNLVRRKKDQLVYKHNSSWKDLYPGILSVR